MNGNELLNAGLYLIAQADKGMQTVMIDKAIEELKNIKHTRQNIPF